MQNFIPQLIDTHGHVNFSAFKDDGDEVIKRALDEGVGIIMPGSQIDTSRRAVAYVKKWNHQFLKAAIGLHPIHLEDIEVDESEVESQIKFRTRKEKFIREAYEDLINSGESQVVAVGEVGLDYWRLPKDSKAQGAYKKQQSDTLNNQFDLAFDHKLPVILHCRKAHDDILSIIKSHFLKSLSTDRQSAREANPPGVVHCYTGNKTQLKAFLALGWYIGYNGIIFKLGLEDVIKATPLDRILLETDSPYLTPPVIGSQRNEPINVRYVAERIADIKQVSFEEVAKQTTENAQRVFRL